jgi:hypothetical protein
MPIGDWAMENELRAASGLNFVALQPAHRKPGAWLKSALAPTHPFKRAKRADACTFPVPYAPARDLSVVRCAGIPASTWCRASIPRSGASNILDLPRASKCK